MNRFINMIGLILIISSCSHGANFAEVTLDSINAEEVLKIGARC